MERMFYSISWRMKMLEISTLIRHDFSRITCDERCGLNTQLAWANILKMLWEDFLSQRSKFEAARWILSQNIIVDSTEKNWLLFVFRSRLLHWQFRQIIFNLVSPAILLLNWWTWKFHSKSYLCYQLESTCWTFILGLCSFHAYKDKSKDYLSIKRLSKKGCSEWESRRREIKIAMELNAFKMNYLADIVFLCCSVTDRWLKAINKRKIFHNPFKRRKEEKRKIINAEKGRSFFQESKEGRQQ